MPIRAQVVGWGSYLPERVLTNDELSRMVDTSDEWIRQRTGIVERRIAAQDETTAQMATRAAHDALRMSVTDPADLGLIVVATATSEHAFPSVACLVQEDLGATHAGAFDLGAACSGFVYALAMASDAIAAGRATHALVVGVEKLSSILDWTDRNTCVLFGDGAGAVVLRASPGEAGIVASDLGSDGSGAEALIVHKKDGEPPGENGPFVYMDGRRVFRFATRVMQTSLATIARRAGIQVQDIDLIIPHQANGRIIEQACQRMKYPLDQVVVNLDRYGNTSAASVPIALCEAADSGRIREGDLVALVAFGGGLTWGSALLRWGHLEPPLWHQALRARVGQFFGDALHRWHRLREALLDLADNAVRSVRRVRRRGRALALRILRREASDGGESQPRQVGTDQASVPPPDGPEAIE